MKKEDAIKLIENHQQNHPIGTKILIEIEITKIDGYTNIIESLFVKETQKDFENKNGFCINKIHQKDTRVINDFTIDDAMEILNKAVKEKSLS